MWYSRHLRRCDCSAQRRGNGRTGLRLSSLRHICSVGEPLNPEVIRWGQEAFGLNHPTTRGGRPRRDASRSPTTLCDVRPGSMGPFAGATAAVVDGESAEPLPPMQEGLLALAPPALHVPGVLEETDVYEAKSGRMVPDRRPRLRGT